MCVQKAAAEQICMVVCVRGPVHMLWNCLQKVYGTNIT